jgi:hypothetical protein
MSPFGTIQLPHTHKYPRIPYRYPIYRYLTAPYGTTHTDTLQYHTGTKHTATPSTGTLRYTTNPIQVPYQGLETSSSHHLHGIQTCRCFGKPAVGMQKMPTAGSFETPMNYLQVKSCVLTCRDTNSADLCLCPCDKA